MAKPKRQISWEEFSQRSKRDFLLARVCRSLGKYEEAAKYEERAVVGECIKRILNPHIIAKR